MQKRANLIRLWVTDVAAELGRLWTSIRMCWGRARRMTAGRDDGGTEMTV
ncbi:MAG: hypothetical protein LBK23_10865 [Oscillospiraceae bacterium]|nr:hypothetical protein [Oscillospiraceae bacterium]